MNDSGRIVDLVIVVTSPDEVGEMSDRFERAGLRQSDEVVEANMGIRSRLFPIAGGGFIELATEDSPGSAVHRGAFAETPRLVSVSYTTPDIHGDLERWKQTPGAERASAGCGSWRREDGSFGYFLSIAPAPPTGDVFFALRDRRLFPPPYLEVAETSPAIRRVTVSGPDADVFRKQHAELLDLPGRGNVLHAGSTDVVFEQTDMARTELTVTLAVPNPDVSVPLVSGRFEFVSDHGE